MQIYAARDMNGVLALFENQPSYEEGTYFAVVGDCWVISGLDGESPPETFMHVKPGQCVECQTLTGNLIEDHSDEQSSELPSVQDGSPSAVQADEQRGAALD